MKRLYMPSHLPGNCFVGSSSPLLGSCIYQAVRCGKTCTAIQGRRRGGAGDLLEALRNTRNTDGGKRSPQRVDLRHPTRHPRRLTGPWEHLCLSSCSSERQVAEGRSHHLRHHLRRPTVSVGHAGRRKQTFMHTPAGGVVGQV
ncbi:hypothetical protein E2C01_050597 [Portunus trituberculatus]|uniref:Uncharacterized protein n=1 Tax=Portunus trituberculatus TaxID=210409 RepID=A0A5B7GCJ2_PORTR|nr:hypothetical protein [Portunus trituberculatus]